MLKPHAIDQKHDGAQEFKDLDMAAYSKATFGMYGGEKKRVKFRMHNSMCGVFIDQFGKDITFRPLDEKHSELNVDVFVSTQFYGWVFGLGKHVQLVGPVECVTEMKEMMNGIMEKMDQEAKRNIKNRMILRQQLLRKRDGCCFFDAEKLFFKQVFLMDTLNCRL